MQQKQEMASEDTSLLSKEDGVVAVAARKAFEGADPEASRYVYNVGLLILLGGMICDFGLKCCRDI